MFNRLILKQFCILLIVSYLCAGCATIPTVESVKAQDYNKTPQRVVILSYPGTVRIRDEATRGLSTFLAGCNISTATFSEDQLHSSADTPEALFSRYNPDWVMEIKRISSQSSTPTMYGAPVGAPQEIYVVYNFTVLDKSENRRVWRANVGVPMIQGIFSPDVEDSKNEAIKTIIKKMQSDGLLASCRNDQN